MDWTNARGFVGTFLLVGWSVCAEAGVVLVAGAPSYDADTGTGMRGEKVETLPGHGVNLLGTAVGYAVKYEAGVDKGDRAVRWEASGTAATELGHLGTDSYGATSASAYAINDSGTAVGTAAKHVGGTNQGTRAVRWAAGGTAAAELGHLGTNSSGWTTAAAFAVDNAGTVVGSASKYEGGISKGTRAVRWDADQTVATELGNLGTRTNGITYAEAYDVNDMGTVVGYANRYEGDALKGTRAVRWDAGGTAATELGHLGTDSNGATSALAHAVNEAGTAVGSATKYAGGLGKGDRAVRWDAGSTAAVELDSLGTDLNGFTSASADAVNSVGTAVGFATKYEGGINRGSRAVRWDAAGTAAIELGNLGTAGSGFAESYAIGINAAGTAVGRAMKYENGIAVGNRATMWLPNGNVIDLTGLGVAPLLGGGAWILTTADALSADGWVAGKGEFDPDGAGPVASYVRLWGAQIGLGGNWTTPSGGTWGHGANWSTGTPALQVGDATFALDASYEVALDRPTVTQSITVTAGAVTLAGNGHALTAENGVTIAPAATLKANSTLLADVMNRGTLVLDAPSGPMAVGAVEGDGDTVIGATAATAVLITGHIRQETLTIHAGSKLALQSSAGAGATSVVDFLRIADRTGGFAWDDLSGTAPVDAGRPNAGAAPVPEPSTFWLISLGGIAALTFRVRRRR